MTDPQSEPAVDHDIAVRVALARLYHNVMVDLTIKGEARVNGRRFWRDDEGVIHWEDVNE